MKRLTPFQLDAKARGARLLVWAAGAVFTVAYFRVQILDHHKYDVQSASNRLRWIPLPAPRGVITDRHGMIIAENVPGYTVTLLPAPEDSLRRRLQRIAPFVHLDAAGIERVLQRFRRAQYQPVVVLTDAPFDVVSALDERRLILPGVVIQPEPKRHYPDSSAVAHLVGIVGEVTDQDLVTRRDSSLRLGSLIGKDGLERAYDDTLRGQDGERFVEVSARGYVVREAGAAQTLYPEPGATLRTTIDLDLQRYISRVFPPGMRGAIVALLPSTGEILALYSAPSYDPNAFVGGVSPEYWRALNQSDARPLLDRAIQARYPPGSTWKLAIAAMALKRGTVTMSSRMPIPCRGGMQYGNRFFRCWSADGHGSLTLEQAIAQSCDVYFYQLGLKLGLTSLLEDANALGLRSRTGVDLPGEMAPQFPSGTEYYDRLYGPRRWTSAVSLNLAIGQGENSQTLLDMVRLYQMLASDGKSRPPYLVRPPTTEPTYDLGLSPEQLAGLRQAMINVVERGTGQGARLAELKIAGKTGTAQSTQGINHGWFIGFAPADSPRVVVGVIGEYSGHGAALAPLVARVIAHYLGADTTTARYQFTLPSDSAPRDTLLIGTPPDSLLHIPDSTRVPPIP
ncbi:MAG TPA: penicillin-binding protein 2 [Gemmatimonadales bacterium]|nr:penicillin-binding protein 2 [Gemmatimonadales bacterium]